MKRLLAAAFGLVAAGCAPTHNADGVPPGDGPLVGIYKAAIDDGSGTSRRAKLSVWAELPDRLHAELIGPIGGVSFVLDAGHGRVCVVDVAAGEAYAGEDDAAAIDALVGVPISAADAVAALLSGSAPPGLSVTRDESVSGTLPRTVRIAAGRSSLTLTRLRYARGSAASGGLGTGEPPPRVTVHPLTALRPLTGMDADVTVPRPFVKFAEGNDFALAGNGPGGEMKNEMKVFSGNGNPALARAICHYLRLPMGEWKLSRFSDGEVYCQILENVRGTDVFVIQPTCHPVNENIVELLIAVDAMKRSSAARITAVIPYYGYARQDRKDKPRVPISARLVADLLTAAGVDRLLTMDLHAPAIQGFFDLPVDHLFAAPVLLDWVEHQRFENLTIVSPDAGGVERARAFAKKLEAGLVIIDKRRVEANVAETMNVIGEVSGRTCVIVDDIVDTAGTLVGAVKALRDEGASRVLGCFTHAVLSGPAMERIAGAELEHLVVTDSIPLSEAQTQNPKITVRSVASLLGEAIARIHSNSSVSSLFV